METWMNQTWWLYDLTVIAIVTLCILKISRLQALPLTTGLTTGAATG